MISHGVQVNPPSRERLCASTLADLPSPGLRKLVTPRYSPRGPVGTMAVNGITVGAVRQGLHARSSMRQTRYWSPVIEGSWGDPDGPLFPTQ